VSKEKIIPIKKKVAASVAKQYLLEAKELNMSLSTYIDWLKHKANYTTKYDDLIADYESKKATQGKAEDKEDNEGKDNSGGYLFSDYNEGNEAG